MDTPALPSWRDTATRRAIETFVATVCDGPNAVPTEERVAVFDNDGTLWSEKPMPTQLAYVVERWREAATRDPSLADRQPYRAAVTGDLAWLGTAIDKHYAGDDSDLGVVIQALVGLTDGVSVEDYTRGRQLQRRHADARLRTRRSAPRTRAAAPSRRSGSRRRALRHGD